MDPARILGDHRLSRYLHTADALFQSQAQPGWRMSYLAGKLVELRAAKASGLLTTGIDLVRQAQNALEPAAWVTSTHSLFFPVDARTWGVDLSRLAVVRVPGIPAMLRVADRLIRSGAFGLILVDCVSSLPPPAPEPGGKGSNFSCISFSQQSRLLRLAKQHHSTLVFLTSRHAPLSAENTLICLRGEAQRRREALDLYHVHIHMLKDKQCGPGWRHEIRCCGPDGLC